MRIRSWRGLTVFIIWLLLAGGCSGQSELAANYLGQTPPSDLPVRFAPDLVSTGHHEHSRIVFSPDGLEMYWAVIPVDPEYKPETGSPFLPDQQNIWFTRQSYTGWSKPGILPVTADGRASSPAMAVDGRTFYYWALDPQGDPDERPKPSLLYAVTRDNGDWSNPVVVADILPHEKGRASISFCFSANGNLYFDFGGPDETGAWQWEIYVSECKYGIYGEPQLLLNGINDGEVDWCPWIAPDESYLVWSSHRAGEGGNGDLYVSYHQADGSWGEPINLGESINTPGQERFPSVSPDGRYMFFARHAVGETASDIYWVDARILARPGQGVPSANEAGSATWSEVDTAVSILRDQEKIDAALALLEHRAPDLRDREFEVSDLTMKILFGAGRTDEAMTVWEKGLDEGFFYFVVPRLATYEDVRKTGRFKTALARNNRLRDQANQESKPEFKVITPASYSPAGSYPLLMIIHGGNQSIAKAMVTWDAKVIGDDLIIAYVQSSKRCDTRSYRWNLGGVDIYHLPTAQGEVLGLYREIVEKFAVDTTQVTLAGFSQGGNLSLIMAAEGTIQARGFIAGCPATRNPIPPGIAEVAAVRGLRGTIFVGAEDWTATTAQTTADNFNDVGLSVNHIVMEGKGHEYPDDFAEVLREAVRHIYQ